MRFWLGTHRPGWLDVLDVPMMVSHRTLGERNVDNMPVARAPWVLDSGGFTEIGMFGGWAESPQHYVAAVRHYRDTIGGMEWAAPQDWMCEPEMIHGGGWKVGTHLTVTEHQRRTVDNFLELRALAPDVPFIPVLQGWEPHEYETCAEMYTDAGVDLAAEPVVGVGSVCRKKKAEHAKTAQAIGRLAPHCGPMHGFGVSLDGLDLYGATLGSSDSLAWSDWARRSQMHLYDCDRRHSRLGKPYSFANCPGCALAYRREVVRRDLFGLFAQAPTWRQNVLVFE